MHVPEENLFRAIAIKLYPRETVTLTLSGIYSPDIKKYLHVFKRFPNVFIC